MYNEENSLLRSNPRSEDISQTRRRSLWILATMVAVGSLILVPREGSTGPSERMIPGKLTEEEDIPVANSRALGSKQVKKKQNKKKKHQEGSEDEDNCSDGAYSERTLKLAYELPFAALFLDNKGQKKYEASDVIIVDNVIHAVSDSSWAISRFDRRLQPFADSNVQVGDPDREPTEDSGYEALFHDDEDGSFYVVRESIKHDDRTYHAIIEELTIKQDSRRVEVDYALTNACSCEYEFEGDSKGFEGAISIRDLNNELVILGLCEGNYCSESRKFEKGNGRLVAMRKKVVNVSDAQGTGDGNSLSWLGPNATCIWETIREIHIPSSANFRDYSAITMNADSRVAISSQEDSRIWIGQLNGQDLHSGLWDVDNMEFDPDQKRKVYEFPKNDQCATVYCNIEGVHWINDETILAVSDKMKSKGRQDFRCFEKDQSAHVFILP